jgi:hypothetical protein
VNLWGCALSTLLKLCLDKVQVLKQISFLRNTAAKKVAEMVANISEQMLPEIKSFIALSNL